MVKIMASRISSGVHRAKGLRKAIKHTLYSPDEDSQAKG